MSGRTWSKRGHLGEADRTWVLGGNIYSMLYIILY